jgi:sugar phosphate isomerase/epimerase
MKLALLTVTYAGLFYAGKALSLEEQIRKARALGFDGLSIETKRPVASPVDLGPSDRTRIKAIAADEGVALCALESVSNFTGRLMEERENNLAMMRAVLELARDLGVPMVKIFAAWPGVINDEEAIAMYSRYERGNHYKRLYPPDLRRWQRAIDGIREVADWASDLGITLALQNHAPVITPGYEDALAMMQEVERPNVKLCLDALLFYERQSAEYIKEAVQACGPHIILTHYGAWNFDQSPNGDVVQQPAPSFGGLINYEAFVRELRSIGYDGYLVSEYCTPAQKNHQIAGIDEVDRGTMLALRYLKALLNTPASPGKPQPLQTV